MSSDTPSIESIPDHQVRLKPIFGVEPKFYLAGIYSIVTLAILFAIVVLPGLTAPGTLVTVTSTPPGASVEFGGKHWGTTPLTAFLPEGKAPLTVAKPGFVADVRDYQSGNNVILSLFFPRTDRLEITLKAQSDTSVSDLARADIGRWALAGPFTSDYRFPPLFTRFAADAEAAGWDPEKIKAFLLDLRVSVADSQMYQDYGRSLGLWPADASAPEGLEAQYQLWEPLTGSGSGRLALWLLANQVKPIRDREVAEPSDWLKARVNELGATLKAPAPVPTSAAPVAVKTPFGSFRGVGAGAQLWGSTGSGVPIPTDPPFALPVPVTTAAFWIADHEVTQADFALFTAENPRWAPTGRDALVAAGLADNDYLMNWKDGKPAAAAEPVASVSWYAAQAYVTWLNGTGKVPAGKKVVLPDEFQWEAAARSPSGASMLNQGVWEWTASAWYPGQSLVWTGSETPREPFAYARSLKGGIQSTKGSAKPADRAGWPAAGTTPGLGFRLALVALP